MNTLSIVALVIMLLLAVLFVVKQYVLLATDVFLRVLFVFALIVGLCALFWQYPFDWGAESVLEHMGVRESLTNADLEVQKLNPSNWLDNISGFFSGGQPVEEVPSGYLIDEVYPGMVSALALTFRVITTVASIGVLMLVIYFSYATYGAAKVIRLEHRIHKLELELNRINNNE